MRILNARAKKPIEVAVAVKARTPEKIA
jgi:hypothetical protein